MSLVILPVVTDSLPFGLDGAAGLELEHQPLGLNALFGQLLAQGPGASSGPSPWHKPSSALPSSGWKGGAAVMLVEADQLDLLHLE